MRHHGRGEHAPDDRQLVLQLSHLPQGCQIAAQLSDIHKICIAFT